MIHTLDPVTAKFAVVHSTRNGGVSVEVGPKGSQSIVAGHGEAAVSKASGDKESGSRHVALKTYEAEGSGYLSFQANDVVIPWHVPWHPEPFDGEPNNVYKKYLYGHLLKDNHCVRGSLCQRSMAGCVLRLPFVLTTCHF